jgi:hypothetical protein
MQEIELVSSAVGIAAGLASMLYASSHCDTTVALQHVLWMRLDTFDQGEYKTNNTL